LIVEQQRNEREHETKIDSGEELKIMLLSETPEE